jgi:hypothetical protein
MIAKIIKIITGITLSSGDLFFSSIMHFKPNSNRKTNETGSKKDLII